MYSRIKFLALYFLCVSVIISCRQERKISILETTDLHGVILPFDFIEKKPLDASLANSATFIKSIRRERDAVFLLDNGDNLQGQPLVYYYNFIDTVSPHLLAEAMNLIGYDAATAGNHDIETGHSVYDRLAKSYSFPLLAANAVDKATGTPYFQPYVILKKKKIKIAVLGMVTPSLTTSLPEVLYSGIEFRDMVETAKLWMPEMLRQKPDLIVGLFHSGFNTKTDPAIRANPLDENVVSPVAFQVPGFDIIFCGHDHKTANEKLINCLGDTVLILNGGSRSENIAEADIVFRGKKHGHIAGKIVPVRNYKPDQSFLDHFREQEKAVSAYVNKIIGTSTGTFTSRDSYFGSSAFVDLIHSVQMDLTGADVSFAAPLSFDVRIPPGPVTVSDMFKLYRYENWLYTMSLTGDEITRYLEYSYNEWVNTMKGPEDYLLRLRTGTDGKAILTNGKAWLMAPSYNFDSAVGIDYTVDVSKPFGSRVEISSLTGGNKFEKQKRYNVAINSYRGNGGGGHITTGAGISKDELMSRVVSSTDRDLRYYIMKHIEQKKTIDPVKFNNWKIIPEKWAAAASAREYQLLFGIMRDDDIDANEPMK